jgi:hypothetical protein
MANAKLRKKATDIQEGSGKCLISLRPNREKNRGMATTPLTGDLRRDKQALKRLALMGEKDPSTIGIEQDKRRT